MKPTFAVVGAGGVGGYFAAALLKAGFTVSIVARGEHLHAIRERGLLVTSPQGEMRVTPRIVTEDPAEIGAVDAVILGVKAGQVEGIAPSLRPLLHTSTKVLTIQNGFEAHEFVSAALGCEHSLIGVCRIFSFIVSPGRIEHRALAPGVILGEADGSALSPASKAIAAALMSAGIQVKFAEDIRAALWEKVFFIVSASGVGTAARSTLGEIRKVPAARQSIERLLGELIAIAQADGVKVKEGATARIMRSIDGLPEDSMTSMHRDIVAGRPSELDAVMGAAVRLAHKRGVEAPCLTFLYGTLLPQELRARGQ